MNRFKLVMCLGILIAIAGACETTTTLQFTSSSTPDVITYNPADEAMYVFVEQNRSQLAEEVAQGHGEHLGAVTHILGCSGAQKKQVMSSLQGQYSEIFNKHSNLAVTQSLLAYRCL